MSICLATEFHLLSAPWTVVIAAIEIESAVAAHPHARCVEQWSCWFEALQQLDCIADAGEESTRSSVCRV